MTLAGRRHATCGNAQTDTDGGSDGTRLHVVRIGPAGRSNVLVLSRRVGESVMIGADVTIVILDVKGRQVRVGINAPHSIDICREEILSEVRGNTKRARSTATTSIDL
jgi:carbon storage regulator CsrA